MSKKFFKNLSISPYGFGDYNSQVVEHIVANIANHMDGLVPSPAQSMDVTISFPPPDMNHPMCVSLSKSRLILLHVEGNHWCQWIYQFSHEYLHHLINGAMSGEIKGSLWFEETLCALSSLYQLRWFAQISQRSQIPALRAYSPAIQNYLNDLLLSLPDLKNQLLNGAGVRQWLPFLCEEKYYRDHYHAIAHAILHLFLENYNLWRICCHIGDSRQYPTLESLFEHLRQTAEDSYRDSLEKMIKLLLP